MNVVSAVKRHSCHYCDKSFGRRYNLRRHVENLHAEHKYASTEDDAEDSGPDCKRHKYEDSETNSSETESSQSEDEDNEGSSSESETEVEDDDSAESETEVEDDDSANEDETSSDLEDNVAYQDWMEEAMESTGEIRNEKYEKYVSEGMQEDQAKQKAHMKTLWAVKRIFFNTYKDFLSSYLHLKDNDTHREIVENLEEKVNNGMEVNKALDRVIPKHQAIFDGLFQDYGDSDC